MKKKVLSLLVLFALSLFVASCSKNCTCTTYKDGVMVGVETEEVDKNDKCSSEDELDVLPSGIVVTVKCV